MPQKVDYTDYDEILANFDSFCDDFEIRASNAYLKGDQNNGRVTKEIERAGNNTPMAVREVDEPGPVSYTHLTLPTIYSV